MPVNKRIFSLTYLIFILSMGTIFCGTQPSEIVQEPASDIADSDDSRLKFMEGNDCTQDIVGEVTGEIGKIYNLKKTSGFANDETRSVLLIKIDRGIVLHLYDSPDGEKADDWTEILIKNYVSEYCISTFELNYEDDFVKSIFHSYNGLDGKVSRIEVHSISYAPLSTTVPVPIASEVLPTTSAHTSEPLPVATQTTIPSPPEPTFTSTPDVIEVDEYGIEIGMLADDVLKIRGKSSTEPVVIGEDSEGLIVQWIYPDYVYTMRRYELDGIYAYRVGNIELNN